MKKEIIGIEDLTEFIEYLFWEQRPKFRQADADARSVFLGLIDKYPGIITYRAFLEIYVAGMTPRLLADAILRRAEEVVTHDKKTIRRRRERGFGHENKLLLRIDSFLESPTNYLRSCKVKIPSDDFCALLVTAHERRERGESIDQWFIENNYRDDIRRVLANCLADLYDANILFGQALYSAYRTKAKTIRKLPETGTYHADAQKLHIPLGGRGISKKVINRDITDYRHYLRGSGSKSYRDRVFYDRKRFRFLTNMTTLIAKFLESCPRRGPLQNKPLQRDQINLRAFSIDTYIDNRLRRHTSIFGVGIISVPKVHVKATARQHREC